MPPKNLKFRVTSSEPTIVEVERGDEKFTLRIALGVIQIIDSGETAPNGMPLFQVASGMTVGAERHADEGSKS